ERARGASKGRRLPLLAPRARSTRGVARFSVLAEVEARGGVAPEWVLDELAVAHRAQVESQLLARRQQFRRGCVPVLDLAEQLGHLLDVIGVQVVVGQL